MVMKMVIIFTSGIDFRKLRNYALMQSKNWILRLRLKFCMRALKCFLEVLKCPNHEQPNFNLQVLTCIYFDKLV